MNPIPVPREGTIPDEAVELTHVDDTPEGKKSIGGGGHAVAFERSSNPKHVVAVQMFASRYGMPQLPAEDFHVYLDFCKLVPSPSGRGLG